MCLTMSAMGVEEGEVSVGWSDGRDFRHQEAAEGTGPQSEAMRAMETRVHISTLPALVERPLGRPLVLD